MVAVRPVFVWLLLGVTLPLRVCPVSKFEGHRECVPSSWELHLQIWRRTSGPFLLLKLPPSKNAGLGVLRKAPPPPLHPSTPPFSPWNL